ncbi:MAG: hypothetical protein OYM47_13515 [Gemmatimonadota bacterium]|nr:hypothetical protein [Gemmatimonadota bacterium]
MIILYLLLIFIDNAALSQPLEKGWYISYEHSPFDEVKTLIKRGTINPKHRYWYAEPASDDSLYCLLLISQKSVVIEYPGDRFSKMHGAAEFNEDVVIRLISVKDSSEAMGVFKDAFVEVYKGRNLLIYRVKTFRPILWKMYQEVFQTLFVHLQDLPERKAGRHPSEVTENLNEWRFKFDLTGSEAALKVFYRDDDEE